MLVLSRKEGEALVINEGEIEITVVEIRGDKVRLGIAADRSVPVHRKEVALVIEKSKAKSSQEENPSSAQSTC